MVEPSTMLDDLRHSPLHLSQHSSGQCIISQHWLRVDSEDCTNATSDPCLGHFRIDFECSHQLLYSKSRLDPAYSFKVAQVKVGFLLPLRTAQSYRSRVCLLADALRQTSLAVLIALLCTGDQTVIA